jgi:GntR family transcriptional regulator, transcriptional repressor for pyruvate dehydrogenase complex
MTDGAFADGAFHRDRRGAADQVLDDLRKRVLSGELARGTKLPSEKQLASYYGVSGPTIRESVRALSTMGLVEVRHGSGTYVAAQSGVLLNEAMTAMVQLEGISLVDILDMSHAVLTRSIDLAIDRATPEEIAELRVAAEELARTEADFAPLLREYLSKLVALSHNSLLVGVAAYLVDSQITMADLVAHHDPSTWNAVAGSLAADRLRIVEAIEAHDHTAAREALEKYMNDTRARIQEAEGFRHQAP